jgi:hypothetical protein
LLDRNPGQKKKIGISFLSFSLMHEILMAIFFLCSRFPWRAIMIRWLCEQALAAWIQSGNHPPPFPDQVFTNLMIRQRSSEVTSAVPFDILQTFTISGFLNLSQGLGHHESSGDVSRGAQSHMKRVNLLATFARADR